MLDFKLLERKRLHVLALLPAVFCASAISASAKGGEESIQFLSPDGYAMVVPVLVNGSGPYKFLFDTGSTDTVLDQHIVQCLGLSTMARTTAVEITGTIPMTVTVINEIEFGPVRTGPLTVIVDSLSALKGLDPRIHGILGEDVLSQMDYLIDNDERLIEPDPRGEIELRIPGERIRITAMIKPEDGGMAGIIVPAQVSETGAPKVRLLLDSASAFPVLSSQRNNLSPQTTIIDADGKRTISTAVTARLRIGELSFATEFRFIPFALGPLPIDGLLPTGCFSRVYVSNSKGFVLFLPKRARNDNSDPAETHAKIIGAAGCRIR
jgi:hypothetical protein